MARYIGPKLKLSRRLGVKLGLRTNEEAFTRRTYKPGQHGPTARRSRPSEYGIQLMEKQKAKYIYGILEKQFRRYFLKASKSNNIGLSLMQLLETRLDTVVYRSGFSKTQNQARQLVGHGHVKVDGKKVNIPSFQVKPGMKIQVDNGIMEKLVNQKEAGNEIPSWIKVGAKDSQVLDLPTRDQITSIINEQLIVEYYSR